jgi:hypothetical protein
VSHILQFGDAVSPAGDRSHLQISGYVTLLEKVANSFKKLSEKISQKRLLFFKFWWGKAPN